MIGMFLPALFVPFIIMYIGFSYSYAYGVLAFALFSLYAIGCDSQIGGAISFVYFLPTLWIVHLYHKEGSEFSELMIPYPAGNLLIWGSYLGAIFLWVALFTQIHHPEETLARHSKLVLASFKHYRESDPAQFFNSVGRLPEEVRKVILKAVTDPNSDSRALISLIRMFMGIMIALCTFMNACLFTLSYYAATYFSKKTTQFRSLTSPLRMINEPFVFISFIPILIPAFLTGLCMRIIGHQISWLGSALIGASTYLIILQGFVWILRYSRFLSSYIKQTFYVALIYGIFCFTSPVLLIMFGIGVIVQCQILFSMMNKQVNTPL